MCREGARKCREGIGQEDIVKTKSESRDGRALEVWGRAYIVPRSGLGAEVKRTTSDSRLQVLFPVALTRVAARIRNFLFS